MKLRDRNLCSSIETMTTMIMTSKFGAISTSGRTRMQKPNKFKKYDLNRLKPCIELMEMMMTQCLILVT